MNYVYIRHSHTDRHSHTHAREQIFYDYIHINWWALLLHSTGYDVHPARCSHLINLQCIRVCAYDAYMCVCVCVRRTLCVHGREWLPYMSRHLHDSRKTVSISTGNPNHVQLIHKHTHTITHTSTHTRNIQTHYTFMDLRYVSGKTNDSAAPVNQQTGYNYLHISSPVPNINAHILLALERQAPLWRQKCFRCHSIFILYL